MEIGGGPRERRDSESSTDSWSVIQRSDSASASLCSASSEDHEVVLHGDEHHDDLSDSASCVSSDDSDIELEEDMTEDESEVEEVEEAEEAMEDQEDDEEQMSEEEEDEEETEGEEEEEDEDEGEGEEEVEDDQLSVVDEAEALADSAALHFVAAEKVNKSLDHLAASRESPFDCLIGGERNRALLLSSLCVSAALAVCVCQLIAGTWLAVVPKAHTDARESPMWTGLQSRRVGRLQVEQEVREFLRQFRLAQDSRPLVRPPTRSYGNCSWVREYGIRRVRREVRHFLRHSMNSSVGECGCGPPPSVPRSIYPNTVSLLPTRTDAVLSSIDVPLPDFTRAPQPSAYTKSHGPTTERGVRPSINRSAPPTLAPPPPPAHGRLRRQSMTMSSGTCRLAAPIPRTASGPSKVLHPPPLQKKYRHFLQSPQGTTRRTSFPSSTPNAHKPPPAQKLHHKFSKAAFVRGAARKNGPRGPTPPPKQTAVVKKYELIPTKKFKPCKATNRSPLKQWTALNKNVQRTVNVQTSLEVRSNTSLSRSLQKKKYALKKNEAIVCHGQYSNESHVGQWSGHKVGKPRRTVSAAARRHEPQCDRRLWKNAQRQPKLRLSGQRRPAIGFKKPVPCKENTRLDEQIRLRRRQDYHWKGL